MPCLQWWFYHPSSPLWTNSFVAVAAGIHPLCPPAALWSSLAVPLLSLSLRRGGWALAVVSTISICRKTRNGFPTLKQTHRVSEFKAYLLNPLFFNSISLYVAALNNSMLSNYTCTPCTIKPTKIASEKASILRVKIIYINKQQIYIILNKRLKCTNS